MNTSDKLKVDGPISLTVYRSEKWDLSVTVIGEIHGDYKEGSSRPGTISVEDFLIKSSNNHLLLFEFPEKARNETDKFPWLGKLLQECKNTVLVDKREAILGDYFLHNKLSPFYRKKGESLTMDDIVRYNPLLQTINTVLREWLISSIQMFFDKFSKDVKDSRTLHEKDKAISSKTSLLMDMYVMTLILTSREPNITIYVGEAHAYVYRTLLNLLEFKITYQTESEKTPLTVDMKFLNSKITN